MLKCFNRVSVHRVELSYPILMIDLFLGLSAAKDIWGNQVFSCVLVLRIILVYRVYLTR